MRLRPELLLLVALGCAPPHPPVAPLARPVSLDDAEIALVAELLAMQDERVLDSALISSALAHPRPELRVQAALAAGRTGDPAAVPALRGATRDNVDDVAATAAFALGELGDSSATTIQLLAALAAPAGWTRPVVAAEAAHALGKIMQQSAYAALYPVLAGDAPAIVLHEALLAVWHHSPRWPAAVTAVQTHLAAPDPETRWRAAYALMRMAAPASIAALRDALTDADPRVRANAARGLRAAPVDSAGAREPTRAALHAALSDSASHVVINAVRALASFQDAADAAAIAALLESTDTNVAIAAAQALGELRVGSAADPLATVANRADAPLALRATALTAHARLQPAGATGIAARWAEAADWLERFHAARALGDVPWEVARPVLTRLARDPDLRVAAEALGAIGTAADTLPGAYALFVEGLGSPDVMVRAAAARGLGTRAHPMDLPLLLQAYAHASVDTLNDAALAAIRALGRLRAAGVPAQRAFFVRFPGSADAILRRAVAAELGEGWAPASPVATGRTPQDYERVVRTLMIPALAGAPAPRVRIVTERGSIVLQLTPLRAPLTVANFLALVNDRFYAGADLRWHRVVPNFVLQDGDPRGDGNGGPGYAIRDEINRLRYDRGVLGMALAGPDTGGSQFFITHSPQPHLDGGYTIFGRVAEGMAVADAVVQGDRILVFEVVQ